MMTKKKPTIAITGTTGFVGKMVLQALASRRRRAKLLAIDRFPPSVVPENYEYIACDLTSPNADQQLAEVFEQHGCDVIVHAALQSQPKRNEEYAHELQSIGTMYLLHAANAAKVRKLILSSTTEVYGAFPDNPNHLTEEHPLRGGQLSQFLKDKVDVERQFANYAKHHPKTIVTVLRPCTILGPNIRNYKTHLLKQAIIPTVLGFDPLVQYVHEQDATRAFLLAIDRDVPGALNIVGDGVLPLSGALNTIGKTRVPIARPALVGGTSLLWHLNIQRTPPSHIHFLQYPCVADGSKARTALGFTPVYSLREVLFSFQAGQETHDRR